jgi:hypothetical protein
MAWFLPFRPGDDAGHRDIAVPAGIGAKRDTPTSIF